MEDREISIKINRLERYEKVLQEIAKVEPGHTQNKAVILARQALIVEYLGSACEVGKQ